jgi:ABC-type Fe3+/spermidine/putrescine transport system ATPase subunit
MPRELSGGQQQRLALAKTLAQDPELLLMDEPFSNLDPIVKKHLIFEVIEIVRSQQLSLIFVTHDTKDALMISDRIGMIHQGEIIAMDSPRAIYAKPSRLIVAEFFGTVNTFSQTEFEKIFGKTLPSKLREAEQLAIRAEAFSSDSGRNGYKIKGQIVDRKFLGSTVLLIVMIKDKKIEIELPANDQNLELEEFFINPESIMQLEP